MAQFSRFLEWQTRAGEPVRAGDVTVIPQAQALLVHWPFGGFIWNRPLAVLVEHSSGVERIPIVDVTRRVLWSLLALQLALWLLALRLRRPTQARRRAQSGG